MEKRTLFALDGITGLLVATVLLLVVEGTLVFLAVSVERDAAQEYYYIDDAKGIEMFNTENASHVKLFKPKDKE